MLYGIRGLGFSDKCVYIYLNCVLYTFELLAHPICL